MAAAGRGDPHHGRALHPHHRPARSSLHPSPGPAAAGQLPARGPGGQEPRDRAQPRPRDLPRDIARYMGHGQE